VAEGDGERGAVSELSTANLASGNESLHGYRKNEWQGGMQQYIRGSAVLLLDFVVQKQQNSQQSSPFSHKEPTMNRVLLSILFAGVAIVAGTASAMFAQNAPAPATPAPGVSAPTAPEALNFKVKDIDGKEVNLADYKGKVLLVVNVASKCGNTPQYEGLEKTYDKLKDKGFVILGFPANNFGGQEPGTDEQIKEFCSLTYQVKFPMFSKISVKGNDQHPLYKYLTSLDTKPVAKGDISWNFEKFLIGRDGKVIARFAPKTKIEDPAVMGAIEQALGK
jgi:glutathione peroxidase